MDTDDLIKTLAADAGRPVVPLARRWRQAALLAIILAGVFFLAVLDLRPDLAAAAATLRFLFKLAIALLLALTAYAAAQKLSRPDTSWRDAWPPLAVAPLLLLVGVGVELLVMPASAWPAAAFGANAFACLFFIALIGSGPLVVLLLALRHGAPAHPAIAGAVTGLLAGGIAATLYAAHCTDDSPLFIALWYTSAIAGLAAVGALAARCLARW
jgi:hypothetical protein